MNDAVRRILEAGNRAPSGENCQPWRFAQQGDTIDVYLRESDRSAYNWGERGSLMAIGAVIENMVLASGDEGFSATVSYFPDADTDLVARVRLSSAPRVTSPMCAAIPSRTTNRKPYAKRTLSEEERGSLIDSVSDDTVRVQLVEDRSAIDGLGRDGSTNEEVMLTNRSIHDFFFEHVNWTKEADDAKLIGFFIDTLELPPPARAIFKLLRRWSVARLLNAIGIYRLVAAANGKTNASASAIGGITLRATDKEAFVRAGRAMERIWLQATALGLSFQPIAGMLFLRLSADMGEAGQFTAANRAAIERAYGHASSIFCTGGERLVFMFRVGEGGLPTARSARFPLERALS